MKQNVSNILQIFFARLHYKLRTKLKMADNQPLLTNNKILAVAPMMAWTDRHCRYLHRLFSKDALLFTEMISSSAVAIGKQINLLDYSKEEHPIAIQFGGNDPKELATCSEIAKSLNYDEINLNVGCPSPRVQRGEFGASLMEKPTLVASCIKEMRYASGLPITVKCRLGLKGNESKEFLHTFINEVVDAGCQRVYVHARIAVLEGLSASQNRSIPPIQPEKVQELKETFPEIEIVFNGGITNKEDALSIMNWADGVMIGRAAYHNPELLNNISDPDQNMVPSETLEKIKIYLSYMYSQVEKGEKLNRLTRPLLHCFSGKPGAKAYRQVLSDSVKLKANNPQILDEAVNHLGFSI